MAIVVEQKASIESLHPASCSGFGIELWWSRSRVQSPFLAQQKNCCEILKSNFSANHISVQCLLARCRCYRAIALLLTPSPLVSMCHIHATSLPLVRIWLTPSSLCLTSFMYGPSECVFLKIKEKDPRKMVLLLEWFKCLSEQQPSAYLLNFIKVLFANPVLDGGIANVHCALRCG